MSRAPGRRTASRDSSHVKPLETFAAVPAHLVHGRVAKAQELGSDVEWGQDLAAGETAARQAVRPPGDVFNYPKR